MTVRISDINSVLSNVAGNVLNSVESAAGLRNQFVAARTSFLGSSRGEILNGIQALTGNNDLATITADVPGLETELLGSDTRSGQAGDAFLHEIVTNGSPEAINHVLGGITGRSPVELESILSGIAIPGVAGDVLSGITQFDTTASDFVGGIIPEILSNVSTQINQYIPEIIGKVIDDLVLNIDPELNNGIRALTGSTDLSEGERLTILTLLAQGDLDIAAETIMAITDIEGLTLEGALDSLSQLETHVPNIVESGIASPTSNLTTGSGATLSYVDTAEEFEAELASSARELIGVVVHTTETTVMATVASATTYHYAIDNNGRVYRGVPISTSIGGYSGNQAGAIHIKIVGGTTLNGTEIGGGSTTGAQSATFRSLIEAVYRIIPGAQIASYSEIEVDAGNAPISQPTQFNPAGVACGLFGRGTHGYNSHGSTMPGLGAESFGTENLVELSTSNGVKYIVASLYANRFENVVRELEASGYVITSISSYRPGATIIGPNGASTGVPSWHGLGLAIDINPGQNYRPSGGGSTLITDLPENGTGSLMSDLARRNGLGWGGNWSWPDAMHFGAAVGEGGTYTGSREDGIPG
jgi:hypothetical protein